MSVKPRHHLHHRTCAGLALGALLLAAGAHAAAPCVPVGRWARPTDGAPETLDSAPWLTELAQSGIVLLGERHDSAEHHRWQLQTLAALAAQQPRMTIGLEMVPRRLQSVLDRWVAGELGEAEFLDAVEWDTIWGFDPALYLPILHFARMNRIPLLALNVDRALVSRVSESGWDAVPEEAREGIGDPEPASTAYLAFLRGKHARHNRADDERADETRFERFVQSQLLWDRAMAERIAEVAQRDDAPLLVVLSGSGHLVYGYGIPHQLAALGAPRARVLLPYSAEPCSELVPGYADAVFGLDPVAERSLPAPATLGVLLAAEDGGVRIERVFDNSVADAAALRPGDIVRELAGREVHSVADVVASVRRQPPGTWLPIVVERRGKTRLVLAKFPPEPEP